MDTLKYLSSLSKNRWHLALAIIFSLRAFFHSYKRIAPDDRVNEVVTHCFASINQSSLTRLVRDRDLDHLRNLGGVKGLFSALNSNLEDGIRADGDNISRRQEVYGVNTYRRPGTKSFFSFVVEQLKDKTIIIILICAGLSLGLGIKEDGPKTGWDNGVSTFLLVFYAICVAAVFNLKMNRQFE